MTDVLEALERLIPILDRLDATCERICENLDRLVVDEQDAV